MLSRLERKPHRVVGVTASRGPSPSVCFLDTFSQVSCISVHNSSMLGSEDHVFAPLPSYSGVSRCLGDSLCMDEWARSQCSGLCVWEAVGWSYLIPTVGPDPWFKCRLCCSVAGRCRPSKLTFRRLSCLSCKTGATTVCTANAYCENCVSN